jgi:regulator of sirC expression with transglutaminase-like and TPR domain
MKCAGVNVELSEELSERQRAALLSLLADDDPSVYQVIRRKILSLGPSAAGWLRPHALSREPALRRRAQEIVRYFDRQTADNAFLAFCLKHGEEFDLETGAWLLAQTRYPDINIEAYRALLDSYASELRERFNPTDQPRQILAALNHYLFSELGFAGNEADYYDPDNSYLNRVVDRRTGNPINLCLIYLLLARRLRLPITGIGLPGHFVCRYQSAALELYVDVFNRGKFLTKADCINYLVQANFSVRDDYLAPITSRRLLLRICANLHQIYLQLELAEEGTRLQRYLVALAR